MHDADERDDMDETVESERLEDGPVVVSGEVEPGAEASTASGGDAMQVAEVPVAQPEIEPGSDAMSEEKPELVGVDTDADAEAEAEPDGASGTEPEPEETPSLDELVAELAAPEGPDTGEADEASEAPEGEEGAAGAEEAAGEGESAEGIEAAGEGDEEGEELGEPKPVVARLWTRIPFWVLGLVWAGFVGGLTYLLWLPASTGVFVTDPIYRYFVFGGAGLVGVGLVTGLTVWLVGRIRAGEDGRVGLARTVWTRALGWTAGGVALWWIGLIVLDLHRTGVIR